MSRFKSSKPISPGTSISGGLRNKKAAARASKEKKSTPSNKASNEKKAYGMQDNITKDEKAKDKATINVGAGTGSGMQTTDFLDDLKEAYKAGLFSSGTKGKAFMDKYNLKPGELGKLRSSIDMGLGSRIGDGGNVLTDIVKDLRQEGILRTSGPGAEFLQQRAGDIYEPGMKKSNMFLPYEDPQNIFQKGANLATQFNPFLNVVSGIFGSSAGMRGDYYGREVLGLEGEELNNFAASVANDRNLYNQMMATPKMQEYELNEFRAEANKNAMAQRRGGDPDPISGSQGDEGGESGDGTTDPGTDPVYTPPPQNYFTFFDPNLGRYRSGTYDEYLQYVTAKDGGIIQLQEGGDPDEEQFVRDNKIVNLRNILSFIRENKEMPVNTEGQEKVQAETDELLGDMLKDRFTDMEGITGLTVKSGDAVKMAEEDQPAGIFRNLMNKFDLPKTRPPEGEEMPRMILVKITGTDRVIEVPMNQDTLQKLRDGTYQMTNRSAVDTGTFISPSPISDRRPVNPDTNDRIDDMMRDEFMNRLYNQALEYQMKKEQDGSTTIRDPRTGQVTGFNVADGGIINLKDGGMNDMMVADSLMFKDPSDEGEWEYNV